LKIKKTSYREKRIENEVSTVRNVVRWESDVDRGQVSKENVLKNAILKSR